MKHQSSNKLFEYWDTVRNGRLAPDRMEIEPSQIAEILPDVFVIECPDTDTYRFRLAGTRICAALGHELRGINLLDYWHGDDREAVRNLLHNVVQDGAGAVIEFQCSNEHDEQISFELLVLPLVYGSNGVNRMLGSISALSQPYWLGTAGLHQMKLSTFKLIWPNMHPEIAAKATEPAVLAEPGIQAGHDPKRRFRVVEGGLSNQSS